jgi:superfamily II DNA or RNA helicase
MSKMITIASNAVIAKAIDAPEDVKNLITQTLSYMVEGTEFMTAFSTSSWNGRNSFFSRRTSSFPAGFVHLVHSELVAKGYQVRLVKAAATVPLGPEKPKVDDYPDDPRYDFHDKALSQVLKHQNGIIQVATGGGKSRIAKLIVARYRKMTLFLTTRGVLMYQMKRDFEKTCGFNVGIIGDGHWSPNKGVNVGMVQTLVAQLKTPDIDEERREAVRIATEKGEKHPQAYFQKVGKASFDAKTKIRNRTIALLGMFEVVIGEEAHEAGGNSYYEILRHCKKAQVRVALTATPFMRDGAEDNMRLMAAFGPILLKVSEKLLIDRGILAKPYFIYDSPAPHPKLRKSSPYQRAVSLGITESVPRNLAIAKWAWRAKKHGLSCLILVQRKNHGEEIGDLLTARGIRWRSIQGSTSQDERDRALADLAAGVIDVLIGTTILDVGVDVPSIGMVINGGGGKAEVALRQRIGRGLRAKKFGPNVAFFVDFVDELNSHLRDHARQRRAIVEMTPGFAEGILPKGADFPWHLFPEKIAA